MVYACRKKGELHESEKELLKGVCLCRPTYNRGERKRPSVPVARLIASLVKGVLNNIQVIA